MKTKTRKIYAEAKEWNTMLLVLAAIFTAQYHIIGVLLFIWTSIIGFLQGVELDNKDMKIINATFLALNLFFLFVRVRYAISCWY